MKLGLLWFDANPKLTPQRRLAEAAARYAERFGRPANCCHVHPEETFTPEGQTPDDRPTDLAVTARAGAGGHGGDEAATDGAQTDGVRATRKVADGQVVVVADPAILRHHIWVGFDEAFAPELARKRRARRAAVPAVATADAEQPAPERPAAARGPSAESDQLLPVSVSHGSIGSLDVAPTPLGSATVAATPTSRPARVGRRRSASAVLDEVVVDVAAPGAPTVVARPPTPRRRLRPSLTDALAETDGGRARVTDGMDVAEAGPVASPASDVGRRVGRRSAGRASTPPVGAASLTTGAASGSMGLEPGQAGRRDTSRSGTGPARRRSRDMVAGASVKALAREAVPRRRQVIEDTPRSKASMPVAMPSAAELLLVRRSRSRQGAVAEQAIVPPPVAGAPSEVKQAGARGPRRLAIHTAQTMDVGRAPRSRSTEVEPGTTPPVARTRMARPPVSRTPTVAAPVGSGPPASADKRAVRRRQADRPAAVAASAPSTERAVGRRMKQSATGGPQLPAAPARTAAPARPTPDGSSKPRGRGKPGDESDANRASTRRTAEAASAVVELQPRAPRTRRDPGTSQSPRPSGGARRADNRAMIVEAGSAPATSAAEPMPARRTARQRRGA